MALIFGTDIRSSQHRHTPLEGYLYYSLFNVSYARNRLEEASRWLQLLLRSAQDWQQVELLVMGEIYSVRLGLATGNLCLPQYH